MAGHPAPDFELKTLEGDTLRLSDFKGQPVLVNFWATWCGPCIIEFPELVKFQRMYGGRNFRVVTISVDRPQLKTKVVEFLEDKQAAFPNYLYMGADKEPLFELIDPERQGHIPYTMRVKPGGEVLYSNSEIIDPL